MLADGGIVLKSQTVLLKGVNDNLETMKVLMNKLLLVRVSPYYIYNCDLVPGTEQFRSTIEKGLEIIEGLRGFTSGYSCPRFIVDSHLGKIDISPNNIISKYNNTYILKSFNGDLLTYNENNQ